MVETTQKTISHCNTTRQQIIGTSKPSRGIHSVYRKYLAILQNLVPENVLTVIVTVTLVGVLQSFTALYVTTSV